MFVLVLFVNIMVGNFSKDESRIVVPLIEVLLRNDQEEIFSAGSRKINLLSELKFSCNLCSSLRSMYLQLLAVAVVDK